MPVSLMTQRSWAAPRERRLWSTGNFLSPVRPAGAPKSPQVCWTASTSEAGGGTTESGTHNPPNLHTGRIRKRCCKKLWKPNILLVRSHLERINHFSLLHRSEIKSETKNVNSVNIENTVISENNVNSVSSS